MKKRRTLIISLLLIAALALGIGYANMSRILTVNGDGILNRDDSKFIVEFTDECSITPDKGSVTTAGTTANFDIENLKDKDETAVITLKVKNKSVDAQNAIAELSSVTLSPYTLADETDAAINDSTDPMFTITYSVLDQNGTEVWNNNGAVQGKELHLAYNEEATVKITVKLNYPLVTYSKVQLSGADLTLHFDAISEQNPGN